MNHPTTIAQMESFENTVILEGKAPADYAQMFFKNLNGNATGLQVNRLFKEGSVIVWVAYCTGNESDCLYMFQY